jgi:hypothetical protein
MVQLRSCYFCGATGALSEYEARPRTVDTEPPRVVLCDRCHTKLSNVLSPLVDDVELAVVTADPLPPTETSTATDHPTDALSGGPAGPDDHPTQPEVTFAEPASTDRPASETADPDTAADDEADAVGDTDDAVEVNDPPTATSPAADASPDTDAEGVVGSAAEGGGDHDEDEAATGAEAASSTDLDRVYHKLLRFLRNREFPIPRAEAEAVAQSAYDLTGREASRVVQRAVDRGVLEERDGDLHRR